MHRLNESKGRSQYASVKLLLFHIGMILLIVSMSGQKAQSASSESAVLQPGVLHGEDFEGSNFNYSYYWASSDIASAVQDGEGVSGGRALMATISSGNRSGGPNLEYRFANNPIQGELHVRVYRRWSNGYIWNSNINKGFYVWGMNGDTRLWRVPLHTETFSSDLSKARPVVQIYPSYSDNPGTSEIRYRQNMNLDKPVTLVPGQWYCMELMVIPDKQDVPFSGAFKVWIDGVLIMDYSNVSLRPAASSNAEPANRVSLDNYYGGAGQVPPQTEYTFWDQLVVSTNYIGPIGGSKGAGDVTPPTGSIKANGGIAATNSTTVLLTLAATDSGSGMVAGAQMQFSNDNITWSTPEGYTTSKTWTLSSGNGSKTVYAKFKDVAGNWSLAYSTTILLDTGPPGKAGKPQYVQ